MEQITVLSKLSKTTYSHSNLPQTAATYGNSQRKVTTNYLCVPGLDEGAWQHIKIMRFYLRCRGDRYKLPKQELFMLNSIAKFLKSRINTMAFLNENDPLSRHDFDKTDYVSDLYKLYAAGLYNWRPFEAGCLAEEITVPEEVSSISLQSSLSFPLTYPYHNAGRELMPRRSDFILSTSTYEDYVRLCNIVVICLVFYLLMMCQCPTMKTPKISMMTRRHILQRRYLDYLKIYVQSRLNVMLSTIIMMYIYDYDKINDGSIDMLSLYLVIYSYSIQTLLSLCISTL